MEFTVTLEGSPTTPTDKTSEDFDRGIAAYNRLLAEAAETRNDAAAQRITELWLEFLDRSETDANAANRWLCEQFDGKTLADFAERD